jgi:hypothetical protein
MGKRALYNGPAASGFTLVLDMLIWILSSSTWANDLRSVQQSFCSWHRFGQTSAWQASTLVNGNSPTRV